MKQIEKDQLCYYCLSCNKLELKEFEGVRNCKNFIPGIANWQEKINKELRKTKEGK